MGFFNLFGTRSNRWVHSMKTMKKIFALGLLACSGYAAAETVATDPLLRATVYVDIARAGDRVVAVGDRGQIIYSDDEGSNWQQASSPTGVMLTALCFADARHGWAVGHDAVVMGTRDGGQNWSIQYSDALGSGDDDLEESFEDDNSDDLYADDLYDDDLYGDDLYGETDALPVDTSGAPLLDVRCASAQQATAVGGYGYVVETRDGGASWQRAGEGFSNHDGWHFYSLTGLAGAPDTLLITGEKGTLYRSQDNGASWTALESPYHGTFFGALSLAGESDADGSGAGVLLAFGLQGNIWRSHDQGDSWQRIASGLRSGINAGVVLEDGTILLVGNAGALLTSRDQGKTFSRQYVSGRQSISSVLARKGGGVIIVGAGGVRVLDNIL